MACIWWGVQAWLGGQCVYVLIRCMAPGFANMTNLMPASSETTSAYVLSFFIYWVISLPTIWVPIHKLKWLFAAKAIVGPVSAELEGLPLAAKKLTNRPQVSLFSAGQSLARAVSVPSFRNLLASRAAHSTGRCS